MKTMRYRKRIETKVMRLTVHAILLSVVGLFAFYPLSSLARGVYCYDTKTLMAKSVLAFVGRVNSIKPTGIGTSLSYPTIRGVAFTWLDMETQVLEPIKGVRKGQIIQTAVLSIDREKTPTHAHMVNRPGMIRPSTNSLYLLYLLPTTVTGVYAAVTAPYDDDQSIFILERAQFSEYLRRKRQGTHIPGPRDDRIEAILSLVDEQGNVQPDGAEHLRKTYQNEINTLPLTNTVIHLQWETFTSSTGWQSDVPKGYTPSTNSTESRTPFGGPVTMPAGREK